MLCPCLCLFRITACCSRFGHRFRFRFPFRFRLIFRSRLVSRGSMASTGSLAARRHQVASDSTLWHYLMKLGHKLLQTRIVFQGLKDTKVEDCINQ